MASVPLYAFRGDWGQGTQGDSDDCVLVLVSEVMLIARGGFAPSVFGVFFDPVATGRPFRRFFS
jgi:hypothetical protein